MASAYYRSPDKRKKDFVGLYGRTVAPIGVTVHGRTEIMSVQEAEQLVEAINRAVTQAKAETP